MSTYLLACVAAVAASLSRAAARLTGERARQDCVGASLVWLALGALTGGAALCCALLVARDIVGGG